MTMSRPQVLAWYELPTRHVARAHPPRRAKCASSYRWRGRRAKVLPAQARHRTDLCLLQTRRRTTLFGQDSTDAEAQIPWKYAPRQPAPDTEEGMPPAHTGKQGRSASTTSSARRAGGERGGMFQAQGQNKRWLRCLPHSACTENLDPRARRRRRLADRAESLATNGGVLKL